MKPFLYILALGLSLSAQNAWAERFQDGEVPVQEFHEVTTDLYRGGRPSYMALEALERGGVRTVLNLDDDIKANAREKTWSEKLGLTNVSVPLSSINSPKSSDIRFILRVLTDPAYFPVYVHCRHGQDRTGMVVGLFRVLEQKWEAEAAYREMLKYNFHTGLFGLDYYFAKTTHFIGPTWLKLRMRRPLPVGIQVFPEIAKDLFPGHN